MGRQRWWPFLFQTAPSARRSGKRQSAVADTDACLIPVRPWVRTVTVPVPTTRAPVFHTLTTGNHWHVSSDHWHPDDFHTVADRNQWSVSDFHAFAYGNHWTVSSNHSHASVFHTLAGKNQWRASDFHACAYGNRWRASSSHWRASGNHSHRLTPARAQGACGRQGEEVTRDTGATRTTARKRKAGIAPGPCVAV
jgi:hypothetical protein